MISFDFKTGKKYDGSITRDKHNNMENAVKIPKTNVQPKFTIKVRSLFCSDYNFLVEHRVFQVQMTFEANT